MRSQPLIKEVRHYKVEPYVVCADGYGAPPHTGRGGWTWYTGSARWLYTSPSNRSWVSDCGAAPFISSRAFRRVGLDLN
jgi:Glycosyl hydrolase 36 superfamily, catalytic domain